MQTNEEFSNQLVLPDQLAPIESQDFVALERKYKRLQYFNASLVLVIALIGFFCIAYLSSKEIPFSVYVGVPAGFVLLFLWRFVLVNFGFPKKGYLLREQDVSYRRGWLFHKQTSIPFNRIQHIEVSQNMLEKAIGLSRLKLFTAGGSISDLSIPGLVPDKAHEIEAFLLSKVSTYE